MSKGRLHRHGSGLPDGAAASAGARRRLHATRAGMTDGWQRTEGQDDEAGEEVPAWPMQEPGRGLRGRQHLRAPGTTGSVQDCGGTGVCQHNRQRSRCKDCGGGSICQHNRERSTCKDCGARASASITAAGATARTAGARASASITARGRSARTAGAPAAVSITARGASARTAGGASICPHNRIGIRCIDCGGASICAHRRQRSKCPEDCKRRAAELAPERMLGVQRIWPSLVLSSVIRASLPLFQLSLCFPTSRRAHLRRHV